MSSPCSFLDRLLCNKFLVRESFLDALAAADAAALKAIADGVWTPG